MIKTGLKELDQFLGGGIKDGLIISISGQSATGKTQLAFQICLSALDNGKQILFHDTTGEFRPERLIEMMQSKKINPSLLDKIKVNRVTNTMEQLQSLSKVTPENYSLLIIDSVTDLFSFEYSKKEQFFERNISFMKYMHNLSSIAIRIKIPIIVTNIVRSINHHETENLEESISMYIHTKIKLSKNGNGYSCNAISPFDNKKFQYTITSRGLTNES
jgi:DNA repair protein RAD51|tara:strand:- start:91 stop:741 length:651 start_codon:yes stop_codon:yes gene_type:complete